MCICPVITGNYIVKLTFLCIFSFFLLSCSTEVNNRTDSAVLITSGSLTLSGTVPLPLPVQQLSMLGFVPAPALHQGNWLNVDLKKHSISLMDGTQELSSTSGQGLAALKPGSYQVVHKQRNPLWYAPNSYFSARHLPIPAEGDATRFRRGALGDFALFLAKDLPLHSGPVWTSEIGGVQVADGDLSKIFYLLPIGAPVEIR